MPAEHSTSSAPSTASSATIPGARWAVLLLAATLAVVVFVRLRLAPMPLERDEGEYAYMGQLLLQGAPPYQGAYTMKWPGTYAAYAAIMAAFGRTPAGIRLGLILVNLGAVAFVYSIGRRWTDRTGGCVAGAAYAILSLSPSVLGLAAHASHFVVLAGLAGVWLTQRSADQHEYRRLLLAGAVTGAATVLRQSGGAFLLFQLAWIALGARRERLGLAVAARRLGLVLAGFGIPIAIMFLGIVSAGTLDRFWFWTWTYAGAYARLTSFRTGAGNLAAQIGRMFVAAPLLWAAAAGGVAALLGRRQASTDRAFISLLGASLFAGVCLGLNFSPYYMIALLPPVALVIGFAATRLMAAAAGRFRFRPIAGICAGGVLVACLGQAVLAGRSVYFAPSPEIASRRIYRFNPFIEAVTAGRYLREHGPEGARVAVIGSEPEICFYAHRRSVTGYLYAYALLETQPFAEAMRQEYMVEVEKGAPDYVVFVNLAGSWRHGIQTGGAGRESLLRWFKRYEAEHLTLVGLVELSDGPEKTWTWQFAGPTVAEPALPWLAIYRRARATDRNRTTIAW